jgi:signal transduction histidine kinase
VQQRIVRAVDRFEEWLRDVLRASSPLALETEAVRVAQWLARTLDAHRPEAEMRHVTLRLDADRAPEWAAFDPRHLGHALSAVISNAIDFSPEGGEVLIEATSGNGQWRVRIRDEGPGVPEDAAETIFRPFVTSRASGTGIGLALARRVVEQHEGSIRVVPPAERPDSPAGAVFEFRLKHSVVASVGRSGGSIGQSTGH